MRLRGSNRLPQGGKPSFLFPRGLGRRCCRHRCGRRRTPSHLHGARRCLRGAHRLSRRMPGGGRSRARPRCRLFHRLHGSGRGGRRLPPLGGSPTPIILILPLLLVRRRVLQSPRGGEPLLLAQPELLTPPFPALPSPDPLLFLARRLLLLPPLCRARTLLGFGRGRVGPRGVHSHYLQRTGKASKHADIPRTGRTRGGGSPLTNGPTGSMVNA
jgi:hypothetical protein